MMSLYVKSNYSVTNFLAKLFKTLPEVDIFLP